MKAVKFVLLIVGVLVLGQTLQWDVLDTLALALGAILIGSFVWSALSLRGVHASRSMAGSRGQVGQIFTERLSVENRSLLGKLWVEVIDESDLPEHDPGRVVHLGRHATQTWDVATLCSRRGQFRLGPLALRSGDPLGLFPAMQRMPETREVVIYPAMVGLHRATPPKALLDGGTTVDRRSMVVTPNVSGIRDYAPGDPTNRISWGQTARRGRLIVKEFDQDQTADVWLVLDLESVVHRQADHPLSVVPNAQGDWPVEAWLDSTTEVAVTVVASLAREFLAEGRSVGLIATGRRLQTLPPERGDRQLTKLLETLAVVHADGTLPVGEVLLAEASRFTRQQGLVVVTPSPGQQWVGALAELKERRTSASVVLIDASTFAVAPTTSDTKHRLLFAGIPTTTVEYGESLAAALSDVSAGPQRAGRR
ncbi:MAG: DUF58 domain-containing protein [Ilumatobacteraceae bacterium]